MFDFSLTNFLVRLPSHSGGVYPEAKERNVDRVRQLLSAATIPLGYLLRPLLKVRMHRFAKLVEESGNRLTESGDEEMLARARELGRELKVRGFGHQSVLVELFALIREISFRQLGMRHFHTQVMAGWCILNGQVAEMATGEGKTLTIGLPAAAAALAGIPVHVITVNDYLTQRDADLLRPLYEALGLRVGVIVQGLSPEERRNAYDCNITYCTNKELAFDYLKDRLALGNRPGNLRMQLQHLAEQGSSRKSLLRGLHFAIVDEADSVLIDEARTPLIISGEQQGIFQPEVIHASLDLARQMKVERDFELDEAKRLVDINRDGKNMIARHFEQNSEAWGSLLLCEDLVYKALVALHIFKRDADYLITEGKVEIIDEYTGRAMAGRQWSKGQHQLVEAKEDCELSEERQTLSRISYQRLFRRYRHLAGMTGTASEAAAELWAVYRLPILQIPTYRECLRRMDTTRIFPDLEQKWEYVVKTVEGYYQQGRPVLIGARSVSSSEQLSDLLSNRGIPHQLLNARHEADEAEVVAQAGESGRITIATNMAGRGTDIKLADEVADMGGLYVLIVERYEAKRIDRQLIGRCARQGDPGGFGFVLSLEDPLLEGHRITPYLKLAKVLVKSLPLQPRLLGFFLQRLAQLRMERLHYGMRKQVLRSDRDLERTLSFSGHSE